MQPVVAEVQLGTGDTGQFGQVFFDKPAAGSASNAFDQQAGIAEFALSLDERLLYVGAVVEFELIRDEPRQGIGVGGGFATMAVVTFQAVFDNGFSYSLAARAAKLPFVFQYLGGKPAAGGDWQATVIAGQR